ncbi:MAG: response regulator transcription factor [Anaerolineae bacterium]|nr:response regulator transcription factor [Anaerolineae bacterium]
MKAHILIVDDDPLMCRSLAFHLEDSGYTTATASTIQDAFVQVKENQPDLILMDVSLPDMSGMDALRLLRRDSQMIPTIFVTARSRHLDEILGLELGADDYVTKPFDIDILLARVRAVLRRKATQELSSPLITVGDLIIDPVSHRVQLADTVINLPAKEFQILLLLAQNVNQVVTIDELLTRVWGPEWVGENQTVYVHMRWLREKIERDPSQPQRLLTVKGVGYKLVPVTRSVK